VATPSDETAPRPTAARKLDLLDHALYEGDPQPTYAWLRRNEPVYWDETNDLWAISRHADIVAISRDPERFSSAQGSRPGSNGSGSMIDNDDPKHIAYRHVFQKEITPRGAKKFVSQIDRIVDDIFRGLAGRREFDLVKEIAIPLPVRVIVETLGLPDADWPRYAQIAETTMALGGGPRYHNEAGMQAAQAYYQEALGVVAKRKASPGGEDWFSRIVAAAASGAAARSDLELASESLLFLNGGSDTTRHVIAGGTLALLQHPDQLERLRADRTLLPVAIEEMVRWVTPLLNMRRTATVDVELRGRTIRAGDQVLLMYAAANRDEDVFVDPQRFDITRAPNPHVAFGIGAHFCMGANIARLELRAAFNAILDRLPGLERADDGPLRLHAPAFACGLTSLPVRLRDPRGVLAA
jgi:cytochrome P450 family 142 subfamily A polypeptide 1